MTRDGISVTEWLEEIERLTPKTQDEGLTVLEMRAATGRAVDFMQQALTAAKAAGLLVIGKRNAIGLDGRRYKQTVYRVVATKGGPASGARAAGRKGRAARGKHGTG